MAMASTAIVPSVERRGVLVTDLGATVLALLGALYVSLLASVISHSLSFGLLLHNSNRTTHTFRTAKFTNDTLQRSLVNGPFRRGVTCICRRRLFHHHGGLSGEATNRRSVPSKIEGLRFGYEISHGMITLRGLVASASSSLDLQK